jgi:hypothetical protein
MPLSINRFTGNISKALDALYAIRDTIDLDFFGIDDLQIIS